MSLSILALQSQSRIKYICTTTKKAREKNDCYQSFLSQIGSGERRSIIGQHRFAYFVVVAVVVAIVAVAVVKNICAQRLKKRREKNNYYQSFLSQIGSEERGSINGQPHFCYFVRLCYRSSTFTVRMCLFFILAFDVPFFDIDIYS